MPSRLAAAVHRVSLRPGILAWTLRAGAFCCFVGHGAFGIVKKPGWIPYFAVAGIGPDAGYRLMPLIGILDITMGLLVLLWPVRAVLYWMMLWATWTALLRPLTGESAWEAVERAGNFGTPVVLLMLAGATGGLSAWHRISFRDDPADPARFRKALALFSALLLLGHGALGLMGKAAHIANYSALLGAGSALTAAHVAGVVEIVLAVVLVLRPSVEAALLAFVWKLATEALYIPAGAPVWEVVERGGSYALPLALAFTLARQHVAQTGSRSR